MIVQRSQNIQWILMSSKYSGTCIKCNKIIEKNSQILWNKENGAKHKDCPDVMINHNKARIWIDPKRYSYKKLQNMNNCQCCGVDVSDRSKRYIDDDRLVCVKCFGY